MARLSQIIFDCDGVLIDSEIISNRIEAELKSELGYPITLDEQLRRFVGLGGNHPIMIREFSKLPPTYRDLARARIRAAFEKELKAIAGVKEIILGLKLPFCIASSSRMETLRYTLGLTGLLEYFDGRIYSAAEVKNPKPAPDVYERVARESGFLPENCIAVEDSVVGIQSAAAAGMNVLGFSGASHSTIFPETELRKAGATRIFSDMRKLPGLIEELYQGRCNSTPV